MLKTKILKILPLWLIVLLLICAFQAAAGAWVKSRDSELASKQIRSIRQEVLGEEISIRGDPQIQDTSLKFNSQPDLSEVQAKSYLVFDLATGQNLQEKNANQQLSIASLTKLLTAFTAYKAVDLNQSATITLSDILNVKPELGLFPGDKIKALDLFNAMLIGSTNDAARALANFTRNLTGKDFVDLMNQQAASLGMNQSHFSNPMGFDSSQNYSCAQDIKNLIVATQELAVFKNLGRRIAYAFTSDLGRNYSVAATNKLLAGHPDIEAIKTGFTQDAQGAMATKINYQGHDIVILVLDSPDREEDTLRLKDAILKSLE